MVHTIAQRAALAALFSLIAGCSIPQVKAPDRVVTPEMEQRLNAAYLCSFDSLLKPGEPAKPDPCGTGDYRKSKESGEAAEFYLRSGIQRANQVCDRYFDVLGEAVRQFT